MKVTITRWLNVYRIKTGDETLAHLRLDTTLYASWQEAINNASFGCIANVPVVGTFDVDASSVQMEEF